ncbi:MAG: hypothetical protein ACI4ES_03110 [Roseburia sp.]
MIKLGKYSSNFEMKYCNNAVNKIERNVNADDFVDKCKMFIPNEIIDLNLETDKYLEKLILLPYAFLKEIVDDIEKKRETSTNSTTSYDQIVFYSTSDSSNKNIKSPFDRFHDCFEKVRDTKKNGKKMSVLMTEELGITVCPYCNRDYVNARSDTHAGNQLDHFFNRSDYPFLAVSLYNLIPSCGVCNLIKSDQKKNLVSPFDENYNFEKNEFYCDESTGEIKWENFDKTQIKENVKMLELKEAYKIHEAKEIKNLLTKRSIYVKSQIDEILKVMNGGGTKPKFTEQDLKEWIYGKPISDEAYKTTPLGKLKHDILKQLKVFD